VTIKFQILYIKHFTNKLKLTREFLPTTLNLRGKKSLVKTNSRTRLHACS